MKSIPQLARGSRDYQLVDPASCYSAIVMGNWLPLRLTRLQRSGTDFTTGIDERVVDRAQTATF